MRQYTLDCYDISKQSACLSRASKFYKVQSQARIVCNSNRIATSRVSVNTSKFLVVTRNQVAEALRQNCLEAGVPFASLVLSQT